MGRESAGPAPLKLFFAFSERMVRPYITTGVGGYEPQNDMAKRQTLSFSVVILLSFCGQIGCATVVVSRSSQNICNYMIKITPARFELGLHLVPHTLGDILTNSGALTHHL